MQPSRSYRMDRASSEVSSSTGSTSGSSERTEHPLPDGPLSASNQGLGAVVGNEEENTAQYSRASLGLCLQTSILSAHSVADAQPAACLASVTSKSSAGSRGKRKGRQGQKSKEAYNRKRRDKKKQEKRERAAAARQLTLLGHAVGCSLQGDGRRGSRIANGAFEARDQ